MSGPKITVFKQLMGGYSFFTPATADVQQMTDKVHVIRVYKLFSSKEYISLSQGDR